MKTRLQQEGQLDARRKVGPRGIEIVGVDEMRRWGRPKTAALVKLGKG
jgi:hypothetical protein